MTLLALLTPAVSALSQPAIKVPFKEQEAKNWCGVAVVQSLLEYYGIEESQQHIADEVNLERERDLLVGEMRTYLMKKGLSVSLYQTERDGRALKALKRYVDRGIPVVALQRKSLSSNQGHYRIVVGVGEDEVVVLDPSVGLLYIPVDDFLSLWEANRAIKRDNQMLIVRKVE